MSYRTCLSCSMASTPCPEGAKFKVKRVTPSPGYPESCGTFDDCELCERCVKSFRNTDYVVTAIEEDTE